MGGWTAVVQINDTRLAWVLALGSAGRLHHDFESFVIDQIGLSRLLDRLRRHGLQVVEPMPFRIQGAGIRLRLPERPASVAIGLLRPKQLGYRGGERATEFIE